jgi:uncharacterized protein YggE
MNKNQQAFAVVSVCLSIIMAGVIIAYKPGVVDQLAGLPAGFRYPSGVGVSQGVPTLYSDAVPTLISESTSDIQKTISLTGAGIASATADQATLNLGVEVTKDTAGEAISENANLMAAVIEAMKNQGVSEEDIKTTNYNVYAQYDWKEDGRELVGYTVSNMVQVVVKDIDNVGNVIDVAGEAGSNSINGISFGLSEDKMAELKTAAYILALGDAQDKADLIAETLGLSITGVQSVTENSYTPVRSYMEYAEAGMDMAMSSKTPTPIVSGDLSVSVNVHIVFLFQ